MTGVNRDVWAPMDPDMQNRAREEAMERWDDEVTGREGVGV